MMEMTNRMMEGAGSGENQLHAARLIGKNAIIEQSAYWVSSADGELVQQNDSPFLLRRLVNGNNIREHHKFIPSSEVIYAMSAMATMVKVLVIPPYSHLWLL
jgi:hypothetical protein